MTKLDMNVAAFGRSRKRFVPVLFVILTLGSLWWIWFKVNTGRSLEDAFISYRYAQNILNGKGFVYNEGERVLGTTTPLQTLLLAGCGFVLAPEAIPDCSAIMMPFFGILTGLLVFMILTHSGLGFGPSLAATTLFFITEQIILTSVGGMETPLVLFLMALSLFFFVQKKDILTIVTCSVLTMTRIDGAIWAAVLVTAMIMRQKRVPWRGLLIGGLVLIPWIVFSFAYFGTFLPHSVIAKNSAIGRSFQLRTIQPYGLLWHVGWYSAVVGFFRHRLLNFLWAPVLVLGAIKIFKQSKAMWLGIVLIVYPIVYWIFLYLGSAPSFHWYLVPPTFVAILLGGPGIWVFVEAFERRLGSIGRIRMLRSLIMAAIIIGLYFLGQMQGLLDYHTKYQRNEWATRQQIGIWLRKNTPENSHVAMEAIGYQGFYSQRPIIDLAGLVSPQVVSYRQNSQSNAQVFYRIITELQPEYIVLRSFEVDENRHFHGGQLFESVQEHTYFSNNYHEIRRFSAPYPDIWGENAYLTIYQRLRSSHGL